MTYAPEHGKVLCDRSIRWGVGVFAASHPGSQQARTTKDSRHPREVLNAIFFYVLKSGCPWRLLPKDFPPWETV
jgi:transposase